MSFMSFAGEGRRNRDARRCRHSGFSGERREMGIVLQWTKTAASFAGSGHRCDLLITYGGRDGGRENPDRANIVGENLVEPEG